MNEVPDQAIEKKTYRELVVDNSRPNPHFGLIIGTFLNGCASLSIAAMVILVGYGVDVLLSHFMSQESAVVNFTLDGLTVAGCSTGLISFIILSIHDLCMLVIRLKARFNTEREETGR